MGERCIEGYYRSHYPFDAETTLGLERPVRVSLDSEGRYRLRGFIDRLVRAPDGALEIHDYKTSARMPPRKILERDRQLALYEIAIRKEWQHSGEVRLVWLYLAPNRRYIARRSSEELDRVRSEVMALIDRIRTETDWAPRETPLCRWCEYRDRCPLWNDASEIPPPARAHPLPAASREDEYQLSLL
jgi:putative RecB family exonuclease